MISYAVCIIFLAVETIGALWHPYGGQQYTVSTAKATSFEDAKTLCKNLNAHLANIKSQEVYDFFVRDVLNAADSFYIGATKCPNSDVFRWTDSTTVAGQFWGYGQPDNHGENEFCVVFHHQAGAYKFNDVECNTHKRYICEKPVAGSSVSTTGGITTIAATQPKTSLLHHTLLTTAIPTTTKTATTITETTRATVTEANVTSASVFNDGTDLHSQDCDQGAWMVIAICEFILVLVMSAIIAKCCTDKRSTTKSDRQGDNAEQRASLRLDAYYEIVDTHATTSRGDTYVNALGAQSAKTVRNPKR